MAFQCGQCTCVIGDNDNDGEGNDNAACDYPTLRTHRLSFVVDLAFGVFLIVMTG